MSLNKSHIPEFLSNKYILRSMVQKSKKPKNLSNSFTNTYKIKSFNISFATKRNEKNFTDSYIIDLKSNSNSNKKFYISNDNISLKSLYKLPFLNNSHEKNNIIKSTNNSRKKIKKMIQNFKIINSENKSETKIKNHMRNKFYSDTEKKMSRKLQYKNFFHDISVKDQLIRMSEVGLFWGGVFGYCNPILNKFKYDDTKNLFRQRLLRVKQNISVDFENNSTEKKSKKPNLYTYNFIEKLRNIEKKNRNNN